MSETKYTKEHEWIRLEKGPNESESIGVVGITNFAQEQLGDIVFIELPSIGRVVQQGDEVAIIESVKAASEFFVPVSGEIMSTNDALSEDPSVINSDPMEVGWFFSIRLSQTLELEKLMDQETYNNFIKSLD